MQDKLCKKDHEKYSDVRDQKDCQQRCLANSDCVGISYSHKSSSKKYCYVCYSDELSNALNDFGFYERPGKIIMSILQVVRQFNKTC